MINNHDDHGMMMMMVCVTEVNKIKKLKFFFKVLQPIHIHTKLLTFDMIADYHPHHFHRDQ